MYVYIVFIDRNTYMYILRVYIYICIYIYMCACRCLCVGVYTCVHTYTYIYIYIYMDGCALCVLAPPPMVSPSKYKKYKGLKPRGLENPHDRYPAWPAHQRMERRLSGRACTERECHTYTDTWCVCVCVCVRVCVCVCVSEQKGKPSCSTGGGLGDRMAIHSQRHGGWVGGWVCVCVCVGGGGKRENHPVPQGGGGRVLLPPWPARTLGKLQNRRRGGISCSTRGGGGQGEYIMTSIIEVQEYMTG